MLTRRISFIALVLALAAISTSAEAQFRGRGGFGGGNFSLEASAVGLTRFDAVSSEIMLTDQQDEKLEQLNQERRDSFPRFDRESFQGLSEEERDKKMEEFRTQMAKASEAHVKKAKEVLSEEQMNRLKEIAFQQRVEFGTRSLFSMPEFEKAAKVTEEQQQKVEEIERQMRAEAEQQGDDRGAQFRWMFNEGREKFEPKFKAVLTEEQQKVVAEMKGEEFDVSQLRRGFGRGDRGDRPQRGEDRPRRPSTDSDDSDNSSP